jgi:prolyl-tRNA synthetase
MRQSQLFTKTRREAPKDEVSKNAQLLLRAGYIYKEMAGAYVFLPLGLKVFNNVMQLIREEMNAIGGQELLMTSLQDKAVWEKTDRWNDDVVDNWFKTKLKTGVEVGLGFTHEEPLTNLMREYISSFRDLPFSAYQFQTKFRNETRAKSGIMRGREFVMKDLYSFSRSQEEHDEFYEKAKQAYVRVFERAGLGEVTYVTFASGGTFSKYSHEFQTITDAGEDVIYIDKEKNIAINKEVYNDEVLKDLGVDKSKVIEAKAVEVGNIFGLGTKFSDAFDLNYLDEKGEKQRVVMGSYGIGPARLMGTVVEVLSDEKGIVWPISIAPFRYHLVSLAPEDEEVKKLGEEIYYALTEKGINVLYDDRVGPSAGEKFNDSDLLGVPTRIVVSKKVIEKGMLEVKDRKSGEVTSMTKSELLGQA